MEKDTVMLQIRVRKKDKILAKQIVKKTKFSSLSVFTRFALQKLIEKGDKIKL